jgi:hypothetical protein
MRLGRWAAAVALATTGLAAHAEHFQFAVNLTGTFSVGGEEGCTPPDFNQPACPREGSLKALMSFDTPTAADGSWMIADTFGDITNFTVNLGDLANEPLYGGINLTSGMPNGSVQLPDGSEVFTFDWASRTATFDYDLGYHNPYGQFSGVLTSVSEPGELSLAALGLAAVLIASRRRRSRAR